MFPSGTCHDSTGSSRNTPRRNTSVLTPHIPLERNASGMVIYTQDWRAARKLSEDAGTLEQEYIVEVAGRLSPPFPVLFPGSG